MPMSKEFENRLFPVLPRIIEKFGTPFHIYDQIGIEAGLRRLYSAFISQGFDFKEFYAVKALPNPAILKIVKDMGCGFDCSSIIELRLARGLGACPVDIIFTSNNTSVEEFREALAYGGCYLNLDDECSIDLVPDPFPDFICFRINPGDMKTGDEVNPIIGKPKQSKYGVPVERIVAAIREAIRRGAKRFAIHGMFCSNDRDHRHLVGSYRILLKIAAIVYKEFGVQLEFLNPGGGVGIRYRLADRDFDVEAWAQECWILAQEFQRECGYIPRFYIESGRFVTGPHGVLVNEVINVYSKYEDFIGVQVAMPALMRVGMYHYDNPDDCAYHHNTLLGPDGVGIQGELKKVSVVGPICENCDRLGYNVMLPQAHRGDLMITHDTGAHGSAMGFNYNGRCRPQELLLGADGVVRRITRAEVPEDLVRRYQDLDGPEHMLKL